MCLLAWPALLRLLGSSCCTRPPHSHGPSPQRHPTPGPPRARRPQGGTGDMDRAAPGCGPAATLASKLSHLHRRSSLRTRRSAPRSASTLPAPPAPSAIQESPLWVRPTGEGPEPFGDLLPEEHDRLRRRDDEPPLLVEVGQTFSPYVGGRYPAAAGRSVSAATLTSWRPMAHPRSEGAKQERAEGLGLTDIRVARGPPL